MICTMALDSRYMVEKDKKLQDNLLCWAFDRSKSRAVIFAHSMWQFLAADFASC